jgi:hypothetical protein
MKLVVIVLLTSVILALSCTDKEVCRPDLKSRKISDSLTAELGRIYEQGYIKGFLIAIENQYKYFTIRDLVMPTFLPLRLHSTNPFKT